MTADIVHHGHINVIEKGREFGDVVIGLLTDGAATQFKQLPYLMYEQRKRIIENISGVTQVVEQNEWDYAPNLRKYKPDFMIHGDDWCEGVQKKFRDNAFEAMAEWGGTIIEIPYTKGILSQRYSQQENRLAATPDVRRSSLKRLIATGKLIRTIEVHSPLSGCLVDQLKIQDENGVHQFDAMWSSSLTDSTVRGKPDIEIVDLSARISSIDSLFDVTSKPLIYDGDTGGRLEHFGYNVRTLERLGVSAIIIEDKTGNKRNSLYGTDVVQTQEECEAFCDKIRAGVLARTTKDFMIIARIESLILEAGMQDALERAFAYVDAGADGIMIHSRAKTVGEIATFCQKFRAENENTPLIVVPTSYSDVYEKDLHSYGVNLVIYANHLLRASYPAMEKVARSILEHGRAREADEFCMSIKDILKLIPGGEG
ncbi:phosphoenolpyruvate mutase [Terasakiella pusilla]|uniref:phosphoenolpyruvate mutase n=1 Tax=Terasakiella pusilla TaxID=64973 RepID=UPI000AF4CC43|nr:phosphoenolpyruvate mutase [Terasakiella pusilla]